MELIQWILSALSLFRIWLARQSDASGNSNGLCLLKNGCLNEAGILRIGYNFTSTEIHLSSREIRSIAPNAFQNFKSLQTLYLSYNQISRLNVDTFNGLDNLIKLYLDHNELTALPANVFKPLKSLKHLDSMNNQISTIDVNAFAGLDGLTGLDFGNNRLTQVPALNVLKNLEFLSFSTNQINNIDANAFLGLNALTGLDMAFNSLTTLPLNVFEPFQTTLRYLALRSNPFSILDVNLLQGMGSLRLVYIESTDLPEDFSFNTSGLSSSLEIRY